VDQLPKARKDLFNCEAPFALLITDAALSSNKEIVVAAALEEMRSLCDAG
jgi:hypothetical protein